MAFGGVGGDIASSVGGAAKNLWGGVTGQNAMDAIEDASRMSEKGTMATLAQQREQWLKAQEWMAPYMEAGEEGLEGMMMMSGLRGPEAEAEMMAGIEESPYFQSLIDQGETSLLQNASATGGLRGGNIQGALSQFRPALLRKLIEDKYSKLAGITGMGQATTVGGVSAGGQVSQGMVNTIMSGAENKANAALAMGDAKSTMFNNMMGLGGMALGGWAAGGFK